MLAAEQTSIEQIGKESKGSRGTKTQGMMEFDMNEVMVAGGASKATKEGSVSQSSAA